MTVVELIKKLEKMPQDSEVIMFDGPSFYAVSKVFIWVLNDNLKDKVIID